MNSLDDIVIEIMQVENSNEILYYVIISINNHKINEIGTNL